MEIFTIAYCHFFAATGSSREEEYQSDIITSRSAQTSPSSICDCSIISLPFTWTYITAWTLVILAALIRRECYRTLGHMFTFKVVLQRDHRLVTTGPYSVVRHPGYAAFITLVCGVIMAHAPPFLCEHAYSPAQRISPMVHVCVCYYINLWTLFIDSKSRYRGRIFTRSIRQ